MRNTLRGSVDATYSFEGLAASPTVTPLAPRHSDSDRSRRRQPKRADGGHLPRKEAEDTSCVRQEGSSWRRGGGGCIHRLGNGVCRSPCRSLRTPVLLHQRNREAAEPEHGLSLGSMRPLQQVRDQRIPPPRAAYAYALPMASGFLAANGILRAYEEPFGIGSGPRGADPEVAYGVAFRDRGGGSVPAALRVRTHGLPGPLSRERGQDPRRRMGPRGGPSGARDAHRRRLRAQRGQLLPSGGTGAAPTRCDGAPPAPSTRRRRARHSPPSIAACTPATGGVRPWTMTGCAQFRAPEFHDPAGPQFADEFDTIRRLGGADSTLRTEEQSEIALFWEDGPWGVTAPGHFICIAVQLLHDRGLEFIELARAFALIGHDAVRRVHLRVGRQVPSRHRPSRERDSRPRAGLRQPGPARCAAAPAGAATSRHRSSPHTPPATPRSEPRAPR